MKILHLSHLYHPAIGGNQIHNKELSQKLAELDEDVTVFTANARKTEEFVNRRYPHQRLPDREMINGVAVRRFPVKRGLYCFLFHKMHKIRGGYHFRQWLFKDAQEIWRHGPFTPSMLFEIYRLRPDVMMAINIGNTHTHISYLAKKLFGIPLVVIPAPHIFDEWTQEPIVAKILHAADLILALTSFEKKFLVRKGITEKKIVVTGVGVNPETFADADGTAFRKRYGLKNEPVISFIGRKVRGKGIEHLIQAMDMVWRNIPQARLVLAGESRDDYRDELESSLSSLSRQERDKIILIENFSDEDKPDLYAASDVFVMASHMDSFGIVYLEAWASGKPVIACRDTAQETIIDDGKDGLLVEYGNTNELAAAVSRLLNNKALRNRLGEKGKEKVAAQFTWDIVAKKILAEYQKLVKEQAVRN